jgi:hypothetical protein
MEHRKNRGWLERVIEKKDSREKEKKNWGESQKRKEKKRATNRGGPEINKQK